MHDNVALYKFLSVSSSIENQILICNFTKVVSRMIASLWIIICLSHMGYFVGLVLYVWSVFIISGKFDERWNHFDCMKLSWSSVMHIVTSIRTASCWLSHFKFCYKRKKSKLSDVVRKVVGIEINPKWTANAKWVQNERWTILLFPVEWTRDRILYLEPYMVDACIK